MFAFRGVNEATEAYEFVRNYLERKKIAELGGKFEVKDMTLIEYQIMVFIADQFMILEQKDLNRGRQRN